MGTVPLKVTIRPLTADNPVQHRIREGEPQRVGTYRIDDSRFCMKYTELLESCYELFRGPNEQVEAWLKNRAVGRFSVQ